MSKPSSALKKTEEFIDQVKDGVTDAKAKLVVVKKDVVKAAKEVDKKAHKRPWLFVGVAAFFSAIFGIFLGKRSKSGTTEQGK